MGIKINMEFTPDGKQFPVVMYDGKMRFNMNIVFPVGKIPTAIGMKKIPALDKQAKENGYAISEYPGGAIGFETVRLVNSDSTEKDLYALCEEIRKEFAQVFGLSDGDINGAEIAWFYGESDDAVDFLLPTWARFTIKRASDNTSYVIIPTEKLSKTDNAVIDAFYEEVTRLSGCRYKPATYSIVSGADEPRIIKASLSAWKGYEDETFRAASASFMEKKAYDAEHFPEMLCGTNADCLVRSAASNAAKLLNNEYSPLFKYAYFDGDQNNTAFGVYFAPTGVILESPQKYSLVVLSIM